jgi:hypothetical protein
MNLRCYLCNMYNHALKNSYQCFLEEATRGDVLARVQAENRWFTPGMVMHALGALAPWFEPGAWEPIVARYPRPRTSRRVGISMAGNVPLVGLHDLLAVLFSGHTAVVKCASKDSLLMRLLLQHLPSSWQHQYEVVDQLQPDRIDFLLATGSGATARSLAHQFAGIPQLIRANRWSAALLDGTESAADMQALAQDMLLYHGMGCRSVCNVVAPPGYDWTRLAQALDQADVPALAPEWYALLHWEKAIASLYDAPPVCSERLLLEPRTTLAAARPGVAHVLTADPASWPGLIAPHTAAIQCLTGVGHLPFGSAQSPGLTDFADGVDTFDLLSRLD